MPLSLAALNELCAAFDHLKEALNGNDAVLIERASARVNKAAASVRAIGVWRSDDPAIVDKLKSLGPLIESARIRTNLLADYTAQKLTLLADQGVFHAPLTYDK